MYEKGIFLSRKRFLSFILYHISSYYAASDLGQSVHCLFRLVQIFRVKMVYILVCMITIRESLAGLHSTVGSTSDCRSRDCKFESQLSHITLVEIKEKVFWVFLL